jgi:hypothetical protein
MARVERAERSKSETLSGEREDVMGSFFATSKS